MSKYLLNLDKGILSVGLKEDGSLSRIGHTVTLDSTFQQEVDVVHTKQTYIAAGLNDPDILDFFNRDPEDPLYGILYRKEDKYVVERTREIVGVIRNRFEGIKEDGGTNQILDEVLLACVGMLDLPESEDATAEQIVDGCVYFQGPIERPNSATVLAEVKQWAGEPHHSFDSTSRRVWYKPNAESGYISNAVILQLTRFQYDNKGEANLDTGAHTAQHVIQLPEGVNEFYEIETCRRIVGTNLDTPLRHTSFIFNKVIVVEKPKEEDSTDKESEDGVL